MSTRLTTAGTYTPALPRHFITGSELSAEELHALIERAIQLKGDPFSSDVLHKRAVALIFEQPSTRTRVSFEAGIYELGGHPLILRADELQLSRGESFRDTGIVLSRHVAAIGIRTGPDARAAELAARRHVPVVNMLTAEHHPCQALADLMTLNEEFGELSGLSLAYVGDGNNVARSLAILGATAGVEVRVAAPPGYQLEPVAGAILTDDPREAVAGANAVYTDVWVSMNDSPAEADARRRVLAPYQLDDELMACAAPGAIALHCLPAHPGRGDQRPASSTASASGSGTRPRTAVTRRRRCSSSSPAPNARTGRLRSDRASGKETWKPCLHRNPRRVAPGGRAARRRSQRRLADGASRPERRPRRRHRRDRRPRRAGDKRDPQAARARRAHDRADPGGPRRRR